LTRRFRSKVDAWIVVVLVAAFVGQVFALVAVVRAVPPDPWRIVVILALVSGLLLFVSLTLRTHYTVLDGQLVIVSGPFRWRIPLSEITAVEPSRAPWSSPALSLDRLKISYGERRWVLVSPADKRGFLQALGRPAP